MGTSARILAVPLFASAIFVAGVAQAQTEMSTPPVFNPRPPDLIPGSTYGGGHTYVANRGPQLGLRFGYGSGTGVVYSGLTVHDASDGALPLYVDLGWRFLPQLYAGLYGSFAPVFVNNNPVSCPGNFDCNAQQWRFGVQADFHFVPRSRLDPYIGLGGGYEILHTNVNGTTPVPTPFGAMPAQASAGIIDRGWEFVNVTLGFDARINSEVGIGPFVSGSLNEYNVHTGTQSVTLNGTQVMNAPVTGVSHGLHELYVAGIRGTFNP
jgi:hypothetical protein